MKKYILGLLVAVTVFMGAHNAFALAHLDYIDGTHASYYTDADWTEWFYLDSGSYSAYGGLTGPAVTVYLNSSTVPMLNDNSTMPLRIYEFTDTCKLTGHTTNTADPDFCGTLAQSVPVHNGVFTDYVAPARTGFTLFKTGTGAYTATNFVGQSATALQSGMTGFGPIVAVVGGILFAFAFVAFIIGSIKEAKERKVLYDKIAKNERRI